MRSMIRPILAAVAIVTSLASLQTPAAADYSSRYGGNCQRGLRGPSSPCDGYGPGVAPGGGGSGWRVRIQGYQLNVITTPPPCIAREHWVIRNGQKIVLGYTQC
jgi:hypothetical protein